MTKRIRMKVGDIVKIDLGDGLHGYGRYLESVFAFYDCFSNDDVAISKIIGSKVLFKLWVMDYATKKGRWPVIGNVPLEECMKEKPKFYKQDPITKKLYIYVDCINDIPATREECEGLECAAVWDPEHVEDRLRDFLAGRPCKWLKTVAIK